MISENDEILNDLLSRWDDWAANQRTTAGFYSTNPACKQYRSSRQYDSENGALDTDQDAQRMEAVDACIERIPQPHRTALHFNARNLRLGATVWFSPRLPANDIERAKLLAEARRQLTDELTADGVM